MQTKTYKIVFSFFIFLISFNYKIPSAYAVNIEPSINAKKIKQDPAAGKLEFKLLNLALKSYTKAKNDSIFAHKLKNNYLTIVDYRLPSTEPRLWVIDLVNNKVLINTLVAHGKNTGTDFAERFSDIPRSKMSSLGVFITGEPYVGKHGLSMRLHGLEKNFNANAYSRAIVLHAAHYVSKDFIDKHGRVGRSFGCLAVNSLILKDLIRTIKNGTLIFSYYPEREWLGKSNFL